MSYLCCILHHSNEWNIAIGSYNVSNLRYAYDTSLIIGVAGMAKVVKLESELLVMRLNFIKTKIIAIVPVSVEVPIIIDGNVVELVSRFNFLGSLTTRYGGCSQ